MSDIDEAALRRKITAGLAVLFFVLFAVGLSFGLTALPEGLLPPDVRFLVWLVGVILFAIATYHAIFRQFQAYSS